MSDDVEDLCTNQHDPMLRKSALASSGAAKPFASPYLQRKAAQQQQQQQPAPDYSKYSPRLQKILAALPMPPVNEVVEAPNAIEQGLPAAVMQLHDASVERGEGNYTDPDTGYFVFTRLSHIQRGRCCGSACRHCPYAHANVTADRKLFLKLKQAGSNSASTASAPAPATAPQAEAKESLEAVMLRRTQDGQITGAVYTRTGDKGTSGLFSGERRPKTDAIFDALGTVDELNSHIGVARVEVDLMQQHQKQDVGASDSGSDNDQVQNSAATASSSTGGLLRMRRRNADDLVWVQERLLDCGALIAMASSSSSSSSTAASSAASAVGEDAVRAGVAEWVRRLEQLIDAQNKQLPPLVSFILPCGGTRAAAQLHVARSVCRRAERCLWAEMERAGADGAHAERCASVVTFLNRLSDFLFTSARVWSTTQQENSAAASEFKR